MNKVKYLLTYRYAEVIHDLTVEFVRLYISSRSRTKDQMEQAARSGKQNIVEGVGISQTSKVTEIKLLGVSKGSIEELLSDFEDFLRQRNLEIYPIEDPRVAAFREEGYRLTDLSNLGDSGNLKEKAKLPGNPQDDANFLLTLCHMQTFLLNKQIKAAEEKFANEGGLNEKLYAARKKKRGW